MNHDPTFRYYRCDGEALRLLVEYKTALETYMDAKQAVELEFAQLMEETMQTHQAGLHEIWCKLSAMVGLDPEITWCNPEYQIETRYLPEGFGAVTYQPKRPNPLRETGDGALVEQPDDPALIEVPEKVH